MTKKRKPRITPDEPRYEVISFPSEAEEGSTQYWRDYKKYKDLYKQKVKSDRLEHFQTSGRKTIEIQLGVIMCRVDAYNYYIDLGALGKVNYFPTTRKWTYKNKVSFGSIPAFIGYVKNLMKGACHDL